jgi:hypothetical protein
MGLDAGADHVPADDRLRLGHQLGQVLRNGQGAALGVERRREKKNGEESEKRESEEAARPSQLPSCGIR